MKLKQIKIENHSRLADCQIEVRDHLVLVGPNDSGKSSLLRCLDLTLGASAAQLYNRISDVDFRSVTDPFVIEVTFGDLSGSDRATYPDEVKVDPAAGIETLRVELRATIDEAGELEIRRACPDIVSTRQLSRNQLLGLGWRMIGTSHFSDRDFREDRNASLNDILASIDLADEKQGFEALAKQFQQKLDSSSVLEGLRENLAAQLSRALPETLGKDNLGFVSATSDGDELLTDVRLQVIRDGKSQHMTELSDGARALFAIALYDMVSAAANIVAIDEPEVHLHPTSQRSLARLLRSPGSNQKVLATHSPDIVGAFEPDCIVSVRPDGVLVQPPAGFLAAEERMVVHWWLRDKLEPLTARHVVFVEGVSDRIIVQRAAELAGKELDRLGVCLVELDGGGEVDAARKLFGSNGFNIESSTLIDDDAADETAAKLGTTRANLASYNVFVCMKDLEDEYVKALGAQQAWQALSSSRLFSTSELANCQATGTGGARTDDEVASFCRRKKHAYKVRAAMTVESVLDLDAVKKMPAIMQLLASF